MLMQFSVIYQSALAKNPGYFQSSFDYPQTQDEKKSWHPLCPLKWCSAPDGSGITWIFTKFFVRKLSHWKQKVGSSKRGLNYQRGYQRQQISTASPPFSREPHRAALPSNRK